MSENQRSVNKTYEATEQFVENKIAGALSDKVDKASPATAGNLAGLTASGDIVDSGKKPGDFQPVLTFDNTPTEGSSNPVTSDGIKQAIDAATATFRGSYNAYSQLGVSPPYPLTPQAEASIAAAIAAKIASLVPPVVPENNDYCFVQIPRDTEAPADFDPAVIERVDRYKCTVTESGGVKTRVWDYEWSLNNSSFTPDQWAAINSGITSGLVDKLKNIDLESLLLAQYYPDGSVKSAAEFTAGIKYNTPDTTNRTITVKPFCNTGTATNDNSNLSGRVVIPPFVDASGNGYISDDGTRYKVVGVSGGYSSNSNTNLTVIIAPNTVITAGDNAFSTCTALASISLPAITTIGIGAFSTCTALASISLPAITTIGIGAFVGCTSLHTVSLPTATDIGGSAFNICIALTSVDFGDTPRSAVPSLGVNAFDNVPSTCKIIVPDAQYDAWTAASGWSTLYANGYKFLRHSEWEYARIYDIYAAVQQIAQDWSKPESGQTGTTYTKDISLCTYNGVLYQCANTYTTGSESNPPPDDIYDSQHTSNHWVVATVQDATALTTTTTLFDESGAVYAPVSDDGIWRIFTKSGVPSGVDLSELRIVETYFPGPGGYQYSLTNLPAGYMAPVTFNRVKTPYCRFPLAKTGGSSADVIDLYCFRRFDIPRWVETESPHANEYALITSDAVARSIALLAPRASPAFTGTPTAPNADGQTPGQVANVKFVQGALPYAIATAENFAEYFVMADHTVNKVDVGNYNVITLMLPTSNPQKSRDFVAAVTCGSGTPPTLSVESATLINTKGEPNVSLTLTANATTVLRFTEVANGSTGVNPVFVVTGGANDGGDGIIAKTRSELVSLISLGKLIPGAQYRITDYTATVASGYSNARAANNTGRQFDLIVTADTTNKLNEVARAIRHEGDQYFPSSTKFEAWKVWYCIDNDTARFNWADSTNGKGVIYRLIDEFNNDVPYDFKGIQFKAYGNTDDVWRYTFDSGDASDNVDFSLTGLTNDVYGNKISPFMHQSDGAQRAYASLNNIVFKGSGIFNNKILADCGNITIAAQTFHTTYQPANSRTIEIPVS